jgi:hypothetical protein
MSEIRYTHRQQECDDCGNKGPGFFFESKGVEVYYTCHRCASYNVSAATLQSAIDAHKEQAFYRMERSVQHEGR